MNHTDIAFRRIALCVLLGCAAAGPAPANTPDTLVPQVRGEDGTLLTPNHSGLTRTTRFADTDGAGADIAIVASAAGDVTDGPFTDPQDKLIASGLFQSVTVIHAGLETPTLLDLLAFDAVLVWSNFDFLDSVALGDNLADYVDAGHGVVVAVYAGTSDIASRSLAGRWETGGYSVIQTQQGHETGPAALGTIFQPMHALASGVTTFTGGTLSARPTTTQLSAAATLVADWNDGKPLITFRDDLAGPRVDLGIYPPSDDVAFFYWDAATDGARILSNAMTFAAQQDVVDVAMQVVTLNVPSGVDTTNDPLTLPGQLSGCPSTFVAELWVSDLGVLNTGITGFYVDVLFDNTIVQADAFVHGSLYPSLQEGAINNPDGRVVNFGGTNFTEPLGIEPDWVRLGYIQMSVVAEADSRIAAVLGLGGLGVFGRPPPPGSEISFLPAGFVCDTSCVTAADCADLDANGITDDVCTWWECNAGACSGVAKTHPSDMGSALGGCALDNFCSLADALHALTCFAGDNSCDTINIDAGGPLGECAPDGFCNLADALHALTCFAGKNACSCGPSPKHSNTPHIVGTTALTVLADRSAVEPGGEIDVRVFLGAISREPSAIGESVGRGSPAVPLQAYQIHVEASGGRSGSLDLVGITIEDRPNFIFSGAGEERFDAYNIDTGQMLAGLFGRSVTPPRNGYMATFTYRASTDAAGTFVVDIMHDDANWDQTFLVGAELTDKIELRATTPAAIAIAPRPGGRGTE